MFFVHLFLFSFVISLLLSLFCSFSCSFPLSYSFLAHSLFFLLFFSFSCSLPFLFFLSCSFYFSIFLFLCLFFSFFISFFIFRFLFFSLFYSFLLSFFFTVFFSLCTFLMRNFILFYFFAASISHVGRQSDRAGYLSFQNFTRNRISSLSSERFFDVRLVYLMACVLSVHSHLLRFNFPHHHHFSFPLWLWLLFVLCFFHPGGLHCLFLLSRCCPVFVFSLFFFLFHLFYLRYFMTLVFLCTAIGNNGKQEAMENMKQ